MNYFKISGSALSSAQAGIKQARGYCVDHGVTFSVLTTGLEWIAFNATGNGRSPDEGKAIVFPSLQCVHNNYAKFYDLFSKEGIYQGLYKLIIAEGEGLNINNSDKLYKVTEDYSLTYLKKSILASDLDLIFNRFFSMMSGETDKDMLAQCFVESKESEETDRNLEKIAKSLISQIQVFGTSEGKELLGEIETALESRIGEFVLIIGNKGAGKSTFIDRFYKIIIGNDLRNKCLLIRIDMASSNGDINTINKWLTDKLKDQVEKEIFKHKEPDYDDLQGVFFNEYNRWRRAELKFLYDTDKNAFKIKFGEYLQKQINEEPYNYILNMLKFGITSRCMMPCLVFDNTDHFDQPFQEKVFQFAQSIHSSIFSFIICPITDKTVWQLSKSGPFQSYLTKSFYLPIPNTKEILKKRVSFIRNKIIEEDKQKGSYFLQKGIRLSVSNLNAFAACIEEIFINTDYTSRTISWLCNHDIRRCLLLSRKIATSPWISIDELVNAYLSKDKLSIHLDTIRKAAIFGEYNSYNHEINEFILNLFSLEENKITTPLLKLSILRLLISIDVNSNNEMNSYVTIENIINYFEPMGISEHYIYAYIEQLLKYRLITPYDPTDDKIKSNLRVKITFSGKIHMEFAMSDSIYITSMSLVTGIRKHDLIDEIKLINSTYHKSPKEKWLIIADKFIGYCINEDLIYASIPNNVAYESQQKLRHDLKKKWCNFQCN